MGKGIMRKEIIRKKIIRKGLFLCLLLISCMITGCTKEAEMNTETNTEMSTETDKDKFLAPEAYPFCNASCLYKTRSTGTLEQRKLDGTLVKEYKIDGLVDVLHVTEDEVFYSYSKSESSKSGNELWSVPIQKGNPGELQPDEAKRIVKDSVGIYPSLYVDENTILYMTVTAQPKQYDRKTRKLSEIGGEQGKRSISFPTQGDFLLPCGNTAFMVGSYGAEGVLYNRDGE